MNKPQLQNNNAELQTILAAVKSLPTAKSWGGGTIIEPSRDEIIIPAYTDKTITILPGITSSDFGFDNVAYGSVTPLEDEKQIELVHNFGRRPKFLFIYGNVENYTGSYSKSGLKMMGLTLTPSSDENDWWYGGGYVMSNYGITGSTGVVTIGDGNTGNEKVHCTLIQLRGVGASTSSTCYLVGGVTYHWFIVG